MSRMGEIFAHVFKIAKGQALVETALTNANFPVSGSYIDVSKCERFHVLVSLGTLADAVVFEIKQADSTTGTLDVISATYAKHTCADTDDGEFVLFTIEVDKLAVDHHFVSCVVSGNSGANYAEIFFLLPETTLPVTQATAVCPAASQHEFVG